MDPKRLAFYLPSVLSSQSALGVLGALNVLGALGIVAASAISPGNAAGAAPLATRPAPGQALTSGTRPPAPLVDDRQVLRTFLAGVPARQRRLLDDLDRTEWSPAEVRAAWLKVYAVRVAQVSTFLDSPAGVSLISQQVQGWSPWTTAPLKAAALRSAILKASRQGALSAAAVVEALPVRFELPQTAAEARRVGIDPVCPAQCGDSVLAHWAFLVASVQVGAMGR